MLHTFTAPNGTVFHHNAAYSSDVHIAPAIGEPSVEVPIDDLVAFVAHVVAERRGRELREVVNGGELLERETRPRRSERPSTAVYVDALGPSTARHAPTGCGRCILASHPMRPRPRST